MILSITDFLSDFAGLKTVIPVILTALGTAWVTRVFDKKKFLAETVSTEQGNLRTMLETQESFLKCTKERLDRYIVESKVKDEEYHVREAGYLKRIKASDERITKLEIEVARLSVKVCTRQKCTDRVFLELDNDNE